MYDICLSCEEIVKHLNTHAFNLFSGELLTKRLHFKKNIKNLYLFSSHPKYRAALKEKLPFLICGETEQAATPAAAASAPNADTGSTNSKA